MTRSASDRIWRSLTRWALDVVFWAGWGITLHAVANELFYKAGYMEILKPQGEYIGLSLMALTKLYGPIKRRLNHGEKRTGRQKSKA